MKESPDALNVVVAGEAPGFVHQGDKQRRLVYTDGNNHGFAIHLEDNTQNPPGMMLGQPEVVLAGVRGARAVLTHFPGAGDGAGCTQIDLFLCPSRPDDMSRESLQWLEPDSTRVAISAVGLSDAQVLELGRNLEQITSDQWRTMVDETAGVPCEQTARCSAGG